ncbi:hypothetical protein KEJ21_05470 [Candidatus Bathyarchaeota archaeon]|nr:hypothetical protein [Candidatus Bathyarchaeota archaeon]
MIDWEMLIPDPTVLFGGAKKRIEAIRITAYLAESIEPKTRLNLIRVASATLGISRRKVEEEYLPDLETRGILVFDGNSFTLNKKAIPFQLTEAEQDPENLLRSNPEAQAYFQAKARLKKEIDQNIEPQNYKEIEKKRQHAKYEFYVKNCEASGEEPDSYDVWLTQLMKRREGVK